MKTTIFVAEIWIDNFNVGGWEYFAGELYNEYKLLAKKSNKLRFKLIPSINEDKTRIVVYSDISHSHARMLAFDVYDEFFKEENNHIMWC